MLNMNLNTILRCNNNGLRPINAISLARVIATSLVGKIQDLSLVKHRIGLARIRESHLLALRGIFC